MATTPNAPSAGAEVPVTTGAPVAPSPSAPEGPLTDDQLLGIEPEGESAAPAAEAGQETEPAPAEQKVEPEKPEEEVEVIEPSEDVAVPEDIKALFQQPGVGPKVRDMFYRLAAHREVFATVAEAREYRNLFANLDLAKSAAQDSVDLEKFDNLFFSDKPEDTQAFLESLHEAGEAEFAGLVSRFPEALANINPDLYRKHLAMPITRDVLGNLYARAAAQGGEAGANLKNAVDVIAFRLYGKPFEQVDSEEALGDPRSDALSHREKEIRQKEARLDEKQTSAFRDRVNEVAVTQVIETIKKSVEKLLEGKAVSDGAKTRMVGDIYKEINAALKEDRELQRQLRRTFRDGKFDEDHQKRVADILVNRYKQLIRPKAQAVVSQWTKDVLGLNQDRLAKQKEAAQRKEVGPGGAPSGRPQMPAGLKPEQVDYSRTSDDDLLEGKVTLRR